MIEQDENLKLIETEDGLTLICKDMSLRGDFEKMLPRIKQSNLEHEMIVKAARIKNANAPITVLDATAGLGEDSFLLAAAGFYVTMYEKNETTAALLKDALERAEKNESLKPITDRIKFYEEDSITAMKNMTEAPDVILLDPMFPKRQKSSLVKRKLQLLQQLEKPCDNEEELMTAAFELKPKKVIVKRPVKGPNLAGKKPDYSYSGKAVRYDCYITRS